MSSESFSKQAEFYYSEPVVVLSGKFPNRSFLSPLGWCISRAFGKAITSPVCAWGRADSPPTQCLEANVGLLRIDVKYQGNISWDFHIFFFCRSENHSTFFEHFWGIPFHHLVEAQLKQPFHTTPKIAPSPAVPGFIAFCPFVLAGQCGSAKVPCKIN